jgi:hypothetical protein
MPILPDQRGKFDFGSGRRCAWGRAAIFRAAWRVRQVRSGEDRLIIVSLLRNTHARQAYSGVPSGFVGNFPALVKPFLLR